MLIAPITRYGQEVGDENSLFADGDCDGWFFYGFVCFRRIQHTEGRENDEKKRADCVIGPAGADLGPALHE
jgi:hypothetical protein